MRAPRAAESAAPEAAPAPARESAAPRLSLPAGYLSYYGLPIQASGDGGRPTTSPERAFAAATSGATSEVPYRADMERSFGQDFSGVRSHFGEGTALASMGARAAARGDEIAFAQRAPDKALVAHELTHVVQQRQAGSTTASASSLSRSGDAAELEADSVGARAAAGEPVTVSAAPSATFHLGRLDKLPALLESTESTPELIAQLVGNDEESEGMIKYLRSHGSQLAKEALLLLEPKQEQTVVQPPLAQPLIELPNRQQLMEMIVSGQPRVPRVRDKVGDYPQVPGFREYVYNAFAELMSLPLGLEMVQTLWLKQIPVDIYPEIGSFRGSSAPPKKLTKPEEGEKPGSFLFLRTPEISKCFCSVEVEGKQMEDVIPMMTLGHELIHAVRAGLGKCWTEDGTLKTKIKRDDGYTNQEEYETIADESQQFTDNKLREQANMKKRISHKGETTLSMKLNANKPSVKVRSLEVLDPALAKEV